MRGEARENVWESDDDGLEQQKVRMNVIGRGKSVTGGSEPQEDVTMSTGIFGIK